MIHSLLALARGATLNELNRLLATVGIQAVRGTCCVCGCTDTRACPGGCSWMNAERTLCSGCVREP